VSPARADAVDSGSGAQDQLRLAADLRALGLREGGAVLVHASLRAVRPGPGGAGALTGALLDVLGAKGTLVVPTQTAWNSTTSPHYRDATAAMTDAERAGYRASLPAFDPAHTPSSGMGALAEYVRAMPGARRSAHPQSSFAAVGGEARRLMAVHDTDCHLGERSPLGALEACDGSVLHLGTGYEVCTMFHLAEYRYASLPRRLYECRVATPGTQDGNAGAAAGDGWIAFEDIDLDDTDFPALGRAFARQCPDLREGPVGAAHALLFPARRAVRYAIRWMRRERPGNAAHTTGAFTTPSQGLAASL
jgi:aminoglycoside 3-N-acetyltransferase